MPKYILYDINIIKGTGLKPTYEELKEEEYEEVGQPLISLKPTYEELKLPREQPLSSLKAGLKPTYKELKPVFGI